MKAYINEGMMDRFVGRVGILIYRVIECIDGENGIRLIPYRFAQHAKMGILMLLGRR